MSISSDVILSVRNLEVVYTAKKKIVHAVNGVSFDLRRGETLALVGETGAGKTTIAKSILRILPNPPAIVKGGQIIMDNEDLLAKPETEMLKIRGKKIAMIFQDPMTALNPLMTVGDQIAESLLYHTDYDRDTSLEKAKELLEMVGIPGERYCEYPFQFSGGMKQRVVIAMALACSPDLLLADEPTTALDVTIQAQILELINKLKQEREMSMILITHDLGVVAQTCDSVAVIYAGKIVEYGDKKSIFLNPAHPYTIGLFKSIPSLTEDVDKLTPIPGHLPDPTNLPPGCAFHPRCQYCMEKCRSGEPEYVEVEPGHIVLCKNSEGVKV